MSEPIKQAAEAILERFFAEKIVIDDVEILTDSRRRNTIARVSTSKKHIRPASFIVKSPKEFDPAKGDDRFTRGFSGDWAGLQFLSELPNASLYQSAPKFYGGELERGVIVMEDLGTEKASALAGEKRSDHDKSLVQALLGRDPHYAAAGLKQLMTTLAELHVRSRDHIERYVEIFNAVNPNCPYDPEGLTDFITDRSGNLARMFAELGIRPEKGWADELAELAAAFRYGSKFLTLIHSDPCPDNCRYTDSTFRLIDFEFAAIGHAFRDGVYGRAYFPSCWCCKRLPESIVDMMESTYRTELAKGFPEILDDKTYARASAEGHAFWTVVEIDRCKYNWPASQPWGIAHYGARMQTRLQSASCTLDQLGFFPNIADVARQAHASLLKRFGKLEALPLYPAFI